MYMYSDNVAQRKRDYKNSEIRTLTHSAVNARIVISR